MVKLNITMLNSKIHRASVTEAKLDYVGSITIDSSLLNAAGILEYEKVHIVNINNGERFETYTIKGEKNSGIICVNGAAARCVQPNDKIIIMSYASMELNEAKIHKPKVVFVDEKNQINKVSFYENHGEIY